MGVDEGAAAAGVDILDDEVLKQGRFADAGFADDIKVEKAVGLLDAERKVAAAGVGPRKDKTCFSRCHAHSMAAGHKVGRR
jgi:hypothetical protein